MLKWLVGFTDGTNANGMVVSLAKKMHMVGDLKGVYNSRKSLIQVVTINGDYVTIVFVVYRNNCMRRAGEEVQNKYLSEVE